MNKPFDVLVPVEQEGKKTIWNKVGVGFNGGKGISLIFDAIPTGNRVVLIAEELTVKLTRQTYTVSSPVEYEKDGEKKTRWVRLGVATPNKKGLSVLMNAYPVNGKAFINLTEQEDVAPETPGEEDLEDLPF